MSDLMKKSVLLLDSAFSPLSFISAKRSLKMLMKGVAKAEEVSTIKVYTGKIWDDKTGEFILADIFLPKVIRLKEYRYIPIRLQVVTRKNIFNRDFNKCAYCGKQFSPKSLTIDHILPKSQGGKSTWQNLCACCGPCNKAKADRTPEEAGMVLRRKPRAMTIHTSKHILRSMASEDPVWTKYLFYDSLVGAEFMREGS